MAELKRSKRRQIRREFFGLVREFRAEGCSFAEALGRARDVMEERYAAEPDWEAIIEMIIELILMLIEIFG